MARRTNEWISQKASQPSNFIAKFTPVTTDCHPQERGNKLHYLFYAYTDGFICFPQSYYDKFSSYCSTVDLLLNQKNTYTTFVLSVRLKGRLFYTGTCQLITSCVDIGVFSWTICIFEALDVCPKILRRFCFLHLNEEGIIHFGSRTNKYPSGKLSFKTTYR